MRELDFQIPDTVKLSEWADAERVLSRESSAEPGKWQTSRAEYQRGIMDSLVEPGVTRVVVMKAAQVGWTDILCNAVGYHISVDPCPMLLIQPTLEMGQAWSKDRLTPMLRDTPSLHGRVADAKAKTSDNTILHKIFPGGHLSVVGANSPAGLASRPIRIVLADEVDRYPVSAGTEGDPLKLASKRQLTFWNAKTLIGSTPTVKGESVIEREFERSDKRRFMVPCPQCGHEQHLKWANVSWDKDENEDGSHTHEPNTAVYVCEECGNPWDDVTRWAAIRKGHWQATAPFNGTAGFHIPGMLSSWVKLATIVSEFLEARQSPELLQVWTNTTLGDTWEETGEAVDSNSLVGRAETYGPESIPDPVRVLTAGVDVQGDRLEVQVVGWGFREESWTVEYRVLYGDPADTIVWDELDKFLIETYRTESGRELRIASACVDTGGHHAAQVHAFCKHKFGRKVWAIKGVAGPRPVWPPRAVKTKTKENVWLVGVDAAKEAIHGRLRILEPGPGYVHFPVGEQFGDTYFKQLTSEHVVTKFRMGRPFRQWILPAGRRNEALDTFVYALAARHSLPGRLDIPVPKIDASRPAPADVPAPAVIQSPAPQPLRRRVRHSSWV